MQEFAFFCHYASLLTGCRNSIAGLKLPYWPRINRLTMLSMNNDESTTFDAPCRWFDLVVVLQTDNSLLYDRLQKRYGPYEQALFAM